MEAAATKRSRALGAAVALALLALLLVGTGRAEASHSVLCRENVGVCPEKSQWATKTWVTSAVGFTGSFVEFEIPSVVTISSCSAGKFTGPTEAHAEGPLTGTLAGFFFTTCKPEGCSVEASTEFAWEWTASGSGNGTIAVSKPALSAVCTKSPFAFNCKYSASALNAKLEGGEPAYIRDEGTAMSLVSGTGCLSSKANLRFRTYVVEPGPLYVTN